MEAPKQTKEAQIEPERVPEVELGYADVWHEGTKSFYFAKLLRKLTPEEALADPTGCSQEHTNTPYVPSKAQLGTEHGVKSPYAQP